MANVLLIVYDNDSHIPTFPQGIAYIASALRDEGHQVDLWLQDVYHESEEVLTRYLDSAHFDIVGLGFIAGYWQYQQAKKISEAVNRSKNRSDFLYVLGGHGPAAEPEYFRNVMEADLIVVGDGEDWVRNGMIRATASGVFGCGYMRIGTYPTPAYDMFPIGVYRLIRFPVAKRTDFCMPILSGRGCKWACTFCYRMDNSFRPREAEDVIEEMKYLNKGWGINYFQFSDELFMSSKKRVQEFCEKLLYAGIHTWAKWDCNGRLNYADDETLTMMKAANCMYINYGCESMSQEVLNNIKKGQTVDMIYNGIQETLRQGMVPGLNFMWGNYGDTIQSLEKATDFILRYGTTHELRTIRPVTPYPGSSLYRDAIRCGLLDGPEDFYEKKHTNSDYRTINVTGLPDIEFHDQLFKANVRLMNHYTEKKLTENIKDAQRFYQGKNPGFRGYRSV